MNVPLSSYSQLLLPPLLPSIQLEEGFQQVILLILLQVEEELIF